MGEIDPLSFLSLATASTSLVVSALLAIWGLGRQKRFHTFEIISTAHARLHRVTRKLEEMDRAGRFDVMEILEIVREADEVFATVDPYLKLSRRGDFKSASSAVEPGRNLEEAFKNGAMARWVEIGRKQIRRYLRIA